MTTALLLEPIEKSRLIKKKGEKEVVESIKVNVKKLFTEEGNISFDNNLYGLIEPHWINFWKQPDRTIEPIRKLYESDIIMQTKNESLIIVLDGKFIDLFNDGAKAKIDRLEKELARCNIELDKLNEELIRLRGEGRAAIKSEQRKADRELVQNFAELNKSNKP